MALESDTAPERRRRLAVLTLAACGIAGAAIFILALVASMHKKPGIEGLLNGIFAGLFGALFVGASGAWTAMWLVKGKPKPAFDDKTADDLIGALRPVLAELEAVRVEVVRQVNARAMTRVPVGAVAGGAIWFSGTYIDNNASGIVNYGERYRCGDRISTGFVESTINQVIAKRFVKKQQMRWTARGAHLLLQIRVQTLNDDLHATFQRWYPDLKRNCEEKVAA